MSQVGIDGYANVSYEPKRYDTFLVKTKEGCYDFAHFNMNGWGKGVMTGGQPLDWREIPLKD